MCSDYTYTKGYIKKLRPKGERPQPGDWIMVIIKGMKKKVAGSKRASGK